MHSRQHGPCLLACLLVASSAMPVSAGNGIPKQDRSWKTYRNPELGYCLSYPTRWGRGDAFDGAGFYIESGEKRYSRPLGEIDVAVFRDVAEAHTATVSLSDDAKQHLEGLVTFERAEQMRVLETRSTKLLDNPAYLIKDSYYDPQDRRQWSDEVVFIDHDHALFRLELECRNDQVPRFQPVFDRLLNSFRFDCRSLQ